MAKMTSARQAYFDDLLNDCVEAVAGAGIHVSQQGPVIAALIQSDSLNGLRKALLQAQVLRNLPQFVTSGDK